MNYLITVACWFSNKLTLDVAFVLIIWPCFNVIIETNVKLKQAFDNFFLDLVFSLSYNGKNNNNNSNLN